MNKKNTADAHDSRRDPRHRIDADLEAAGGSLTDFIDQMNRLAFQRTLERRAELSQGTRERLR